MRGSSESFELFDLIHCGKAPWAEGQTQALKLKRAWREKWTEIQQIQQRVFFYYFIVSWWNFFNRILVHSPRQLQCQGMVQYSACAVWKMAIKNCQDGLELSKDYFGFAKPSVWLFRAVQHCSCSVLEVCSEQVTGISSLARSCRGWIAGTEGSAVLLCKAVIKDQILLKVPGFFFIYTSLTTQNHAKCIFITGR